MDTPSPEFEVNMQHGLAAHAQHGQNEYIEALESRLGAFRLPPPQPGDRGRAARDISASFDRLGNYQFGEDWEQSNQVMAGAYAEYAIREHRKLKDAGNERGAREFTASTIYEAIAAARQNNDNDALAVVREGWAISQELLGIYGKPHQYDVNLIGRVAGLEGMSGDKPKSAKRQLGNLAVSLAKNSQTNRVLEPDTSLDAAGIKQAQKTAWQRGLAAKAIIEMQALPTRRLTKPLARFILNKAVL
jgi:hypothetical protein